MFRLVLAAAIALTCPTVLAQEAGDFDCVTGLDGQEAAAGILRIEREGDRGRFVLFDRAGNAGPWSNVDFIDADLILFDDALANHFVPGAIVGDARWDADMFAYRGNILTQSGEQVPFTCLFTP